jgi:hypothetical protein
LWVNRKLRTGRGPWIKNSPPLERFSADCWQWLAEASSDEGSE